MKNYINFINENFRPTLKYYCYDIDDNLLFMSTKINMLHLVEGEWIPEQISTSKFAEIREDRNNWIPNPGVAYSEFQDVGPRGKDAFIIDLKKAIEEKKFGPAWNNFLKCLKNGSLFSLITARGHEPETIRKGVEYIIQKQLSDDDKNEMKSNLIAYQHMFDNADLLTDYTFKYLVKLYLDKCYFVGITSPSFKERYSGGDSAKPEDAKIFALNEFIEKIKSYGEQVDANVSVGFSDDDIKNVNAVEKHFNEIKPLYNDIIEFSVIDTSNPEVQGGIKKRI